MFTLSEVEFDGSAAYVVLNSNPTKNGLDGANNYAQIEMKSSGGGYEAVKVKVTSLSYTEEDGAAWNIRPTRYWETLKIVRDVDASQLTSGILEFVVTEPCQVSVELGDPNILFESKKSFTDFSNLILGFNPPESSWPHAKPTLTSSGSRPKCTSVGILRCNESLSTLVLTLAERTLRQNQEGRASLAKQTTAVMM
eukprot:5587804-Amphidinium_carterae.1